MQWELAARSQFRPLQLVPEWSGSSSAQSRMTTKFIAYAVDLSGTALARYDLAATDAEAAEREAWQYLEQHPVIEVWSDDHRRVARLVRE
jgi:hypothetical protein